MKQTTRKMTLLSVTFIVCLLGIVTSCKPKQPDASKYMKQISDIALKYNKSCPKELANGTKLESVTFKDNLMTFRLSITDEAIVTIDLDNARDSIINRMSDKLKEYLFKGKCNLIYKYVSPNDSSSITIIPNELAKFFKEEKD